MFHFTFSNVAFMMITYSTLFNNSEKRTVATLFNETAYLT